jgi:hypothetical protein
MSWRRQLAKLGALFRRPKPVDDLEEEIRSHLEMEEQENLESGLPPEEAHYAALRRFGNVTLAQERSREMWGWNSVETLWQDLRFGLRMLRKNPGFTAVAVVTLALGIGANTAIFTVIEAVLLKPLPYPDPGRVVWVTEFMPQSGRDTVLTPEYAAWGKVENIFDQFGASDITRGINLTGGARPERIMAGHVTPSFFPVLGVKPTLGRTFLPGEGGPGHDRVAV